MANNTITLEGQLRTEFGKGPARRMRVAKLIPATVYAGGEQPLYLALPMKETTLALRHTNALITLKYGDDQVMAVVKDVQRNPVKRIVEHVDFYAVKAGEKIEVEVPVFVTGEPKGGAVAFVDMQMLKVRADVANLPERITVDVTGLMEGEHIAADGLELPEGVELDIADPSEPIVSVKVPEDAGSAPVAAAPAAAAEAPAADAE
ncbi:50S ribosomal protein L25 [Bifidobacterium dolichotidis]|uniref:Large ribosomal subunit protein bL25 n=1 Tax=Bifidobacterium dolichotidis TaxID=2306976 RepID=A0A430FSZ5_9BIFI|nr:50S ribosomal protein L25/general stress protein Ctc [Bifidobacterium dolichotidis]RSX55979.1 50S ribosomal protein L25 [Bifidobacterium dolichotidis]